MQYPAKKVLCVFLLSPALGSSLLWLLMVIFNPTPFDYKEFIASLYLWLFFILFGFLIGIAPALFTGIYAVYFKLHRTFTHFILIVVMGFLLTVLTLSIFNLSTNQAQTSYVELTYGSIGALCALCASFIALPNKLLPD